MLLYIIIIACPLHFPLSHLSAKLSLLTPARMREMVTVVVTCLSVTQFCVLLFHSGEGAVFYILGDDLSPLNVALFFFLIEAILEKKRVELRP